MIIGSTLLHARLLVWPRVSQEAFAQWLLALGRVGPKARFDREPAAAALRAAGRGLSLAPSQGAVRLACQGLPRPTLTFALLGLACKADPVYISGPLDTSSSHLDPRVQVGPVEPCPDPQAEARWVEVGEDSPYTTPPPTTHSGENPGAMALLRSPAGDWALAWVQPDGVAGRWLDAGPSALWVEGGTPKSLSQADLDGDGVSDLILAGRAVAVRWSAADPEATSEGITLISPTRSGASTVDAAAGDLDGDGDLDIFVAWTAPNAEDREQMAASVLRNEGGRVFTELPLALPVETWGPGFDVSLRDLDPDGHLDAYLCQDMGAAFAPNVLLRGDGALGFLPVNGNGLDLRLSCMGATWGDVDADGALELFIAESLRPVLLQQGEGGDWVEIGPASGLGAAFPPGVMAWGSALLDFDNDGQMELAVGTGDFWIAEAQANAPLWFERGSDGIFTEIGVDRGLPAAAQSRAVAGADLNQDGLLDLLLSDAARPPRIYLSTGCTAESWIAVEAPLGSAVQVEAGGRTRAARIDVDSGWGAAAPPIAHIGLGEVDTLDGLEVILPDGERITVPGPLPARRRITVTRRAG